MKYAAIYFKAKPSATRLIVCLLHLDLRLIERKASGKVRYQTCSHTVLKGPHIATLQPGGCLARWVAIKSTHQSLVTEIREQLQGWC
jgi:hypothetical protein